MINMYSTTEVINYFNTTFFVKQYLIPWKIKVHSKYVYVVSIKYRKFPFFKTFYDYSKTCFRDRVIMFNVTFNNISVNIMMINFNGEGNRSARRKPLTCHKSLTNFITYFIMLYWIHLVISGIQTHNVSGDRLWLHM
jgi:hypothetical protein